MLKISMNADNFSVLQATYALHETEIITLRERVLTLEEENARLKEQLALQQKNQFDKKSEVSKTDPLEEEPPSVHTVAAHQRTRKPRGNRFDTSELPRHTVIHDLSETQRHCACCHEALHKIGEEVSEQVEIIPTRYCVIEHVRLKYGCRQCDTIVMADKPPAPIPKAAAGASLLADILIGKYHAHLPLYRQSKLMRDHQLNIPDNTLGNWVMQSGEGLMPLYDALWIILKSSYLQVDETPVKVLKTNKKGYIWTYYARLMKLVVFEFSETRAGKVAEERLRNFIGLLQTDGYAGYKKLHKRTTIIGLGCITHARRKFADIIKISNDKQGIASEMIERLKPLYALEARLKDGNATFHTRKRLRQKIAYPLLKEIKRWLCQQRPQIPPNSKLGDAITYFFNQWPYLIAYTRHGTAEIDTNGVERKIREIALGRRNWLFIGNKNSGKVHALFYSLVLSCVLNTINPRVYLHYVLTKVHELRRGEIDPRTLLPDKIDCAILQKFSDEQIEFAKKMMNHP